MAALNTSSNVDLIVDSSHQDVLSEMPTAAVKPTISKNCPPKNTTAPVEETKAPSGDGPENADEEESEVVTEKFVEAPIPKVNPWAVNSTSNRPKGELPDCLPIGLGLIDSSVACVNTGVTRQLPRIALSSQQMSS